MAHPVHSIPKLAPFQERFMRRAMADGVETACWSAPRGNGKSFLAALILSRALTPGHKWFREGSESILCSGSFEQARVVYRFCRDMLGDDGYKYQDAANRIGIWHKATDTRLRVISSSGKRAMGLGVNNPLIVAEECGAWETNNGGLLHTAIQGSLGKPGQDTRAIYIGTIAPSTTGWWADMLADGTHGTNYVELRQGDRETWDEWNTIRRANPLANVSAKFRGRLLRERDKARTDSSAKADFLSYRLNLPSADETKVLLSVEDWQRVCAREVPERNGVAPIVGVDLGYNRSWSAAVAVHSNGLTEAIALAPGVPDLAGQEKRDRVPAGTYRRLHELGVLRVAEGLRVQPVGQLVEMIRSRWGRPRFIVADRARIDELRDAAPRMKIRDRVTRWFQAAEDIRGLRKLAKDGPLSVAEESRPLIAASLAVTVVKSDDAGSVRIPKDTHNTARTDVCAALTLAAGAVARLPAPRPFRVGSTGDV